MPFGPEDCFMPMPRVQVDALARPNRNLFVGLL